MLTLSIIGASSLSLGKSIIDELVAGPLPRPLNLRMMSLHEEHMRRVAAYARRIDSGSRGTLEVTIHSDPKTAMEGADAVITAFDIGGLEAARLDHRIPAEFGVGQCIGDTLGPGAVMRAQRVIPVMKSIAENMSRAAPGALLLNYANPLGPVARSLSDGAKVEQIGLCRGPGDTVEAVERLLGGRKIRFALAGTNHMSWLVRIADAATGENLYPELEKRLLSPEIAGRERIRVEILRTFGYFCSETSGHLSDMLPWFRNSERSRREYLGTGYAGETGIYPRVGTFLHKHLGQMDFLENAEPDHVPENRRSLTRLILSRASRNGGIPEDSPPPVFGNVVNARGRISNLPRDAVVETVLSPRDGSWEPRDVLEIPEAVLGLTNRHVDANRAMATAAVEGNPEGLVRAMAIDPLCSSVLGLGTIREMTRALLEAQREWLPQYEKKTVVRGIDFGNLPRTDEGPFDGESAVAMVRRYSKGR